MRALLVSLVVAPLCLSLGCGPGEPSDFCAEALEANEACLTNSSAEECEAANDACPGRVAVAESCPVQFSCPEG